MVCIYTILTTMIFIRSFFSKKKSLLIYIVLFLFSLLMESFSSFFIIFVLLYSLTIPGYIILRKFKFNNNLDPIEKFTLSFFFSVIYLIIISTINWYHLTNKWVLGIYLTIIPLFIELLSNYDTQFFDITNLKFKNFKKIIKNPLVFILIAVIISVFIHGTPSLINEYPLGFDTYRLHIIRINYILNNGRNILGDLITKDFLNPFRYQWGFHLFASSLGFLTDQNSIFILKLLPVIDSIILPISIYTICPLFGITNKKKKIFATLISPLFLYDEIILGLIYPFPSSMSLILFIIIFRIIYEILKMDRKLIILLLGLIPIFFYFYKGLGIITFFIFITFVPIIIFDKHLKDKSENKKFKKIHLILLFYCIITSYICLIGLNFVFQNIEDELNIISLFSLELNIFQMYRIAGIVSSIFLTFSILYLIYENISVKKKNYNFYFLLVFLFLLILSSGSYMGSRWLLYMIPIIIFLNTNFLYKFISVLVSKVANLRNFRWKAIHFNTGLTILLILILSIEPFSHTLEPPFPLNPEFSDSEERVYEQIKTLDNNSVVLSTYIVNKYISLYAISKELLLLPNNNLINYYLISTSGYPLKQKYRIFESGGSVTLINSTIDGSKIIDLDDKKNNSIVAFTEGFREQSVGEIHFRFKKNTYDPGKIRLNSSFGREISLILHNKSNTILCETSTGWEEISNVSINKWYDIVIKFDKSKNPQYELYVNNTLRFSNNFLIGSNNLLKIEFNTSIFESNYHFYIDPPIYSWEDNFSQWAHSHYGVNQPIYFILRKANFPFEFKNMIFSASLVSFVNVTHLEFDYAILKV